MIFRCPFWFQKIFCTSGTVSGPSPRTLCSLEISELLRWRSLEISELLRWRSGPTHVSSICQLPEECGRASDHPSIRAPHGSSVRPIRVALRNGDRWLACVPGCKCAAASGSDGDLAERAIARLREEIRIPVCRSDTRHP
jgi:hypothetical protein